MKRLAFACLLLAACGEEEAQIPDPIPLTAEVASHYCLMQVDAHGGPKAQIHLEGLPDPIFFAQARDGLAYLKGSERLLPVLVTYVSDMAAAPSWDAPGANNWIDAKTAHFVVGSDAVGGMGAPEVAPFSNKEAAARFAALRGGSVVSLDEIPMDALFGEVDLSLAQDAAQ